MPDVDLLPEGDEPAGFDFTGDGEDEIDLSQLTVNFTTQEAESEAFGFEVLPSGKYYCRITDVKVKRCGPESKNPGKPYYNLELTVQEGKYERRKLFTNVMLFEGALYSLAQLHKALGHPNTGQVIQPAALLTREIVAVVRRVNDDYAAKRDGWTPDEGPKPKKAEVSGFQAYVPGAAGLQGAAGAGVATSGGTLLP